MSSNEIILSSHRPDDGSGTVTINVDALTSEIRDANGRPLAPPIEPPITKANVDTQVVTGYQGSSEQDGPILYAPMPGYGHSREPSLVSWFMFGGIIFTILAAISYLGQ